jgi:hypothetical protein
VHDATVSEGPKTPGPFDLADRKEWSGAVGLARLIDPSSKGAIMRKFLLLTGAALFALALTSSSALAAVNVKRLPVADFGNPDAASVTLFGGNFSGLGSVPAIATLEVTGTVDYDCANPQGHLSPGQNPVAAQPGLAQQDLGNADHNGRGTINDLTATATAPDPAPSAQEVGCGGGGSTQWTVVNPVVTVTGAHLTITQNGVIVFCRNYTEDGTGTAC